MFELGTFLVSIVSFLILFLLIRQVGFKPLARMFEQRRLYVEKQLGDAEENRTQAEQMLAEQKKLLEQARDDARNLLDTARIRSDEQARDIIKQAQEEAQRLLEENRQLIERERAEALNSVLARVAELSVELTDKLLKNHVSPAVHDDMLVEAKEKLGELVC